MKTKNNIDIKSTLLRIVFVLIFTCTISALFGQISSDKSVFQTTTQYDGGIENDKIFVFCGANSGELVAKPANGSSGWSFSWTKWDATSGTFTIPVSSTDSSTESVISTVVDGLYRVEMSDGTSVITDKAWVLNRTLSTEKPLLVLDKKDCSGLAFLGSFSGLLQYQDTGSKIFKNVPEDMIFEFSRSGLSDVILRTTFNYQGEEKLLIDLSVFEGTEDYTLQITDKCGNVYTSDVLQSETIRISALYQIETDAELVDGGYEAPVKIKFKAENTTNIENYEWNIYKDDGGNPENLDDEDLIENGRISGVSEFDFEFVHTGKYFIKLKVSSSTCEEQYIDIKGLQIIESLVDVANYFIPGKHKNWIVKTRSLKSFHGIILNRWGRVVYEWRNPDEGWNGKINGKWASPGTYFYVITAVGREEETQKHTKKGSFTLIRK